MEPRGWKGAGETIPTFPRSLDFLPQALSSLESVITSYPFYYRPKGLRLGDAWHFHPPERYYERVAREVGAVVGAWQGRGDVALTGYPKPGLRPSLRCRPTRGG